MTKLLNGWDMAKKIQTNCKVFMKTFSGATVSCMEDYVKPSLRNLPDHFILHVGTNDLSSDKSPHEIAEIDDKPGMSTKKRKARRKCLDDYIEN